MVLHCTMLLVPLQATGLREERRRRGASARMGALLRAMEERARKTCDQDGGGQAFVPLLLLDLRRTYGPCFAAAVGSVDD